MSTVNPVLIDEGDDYNKSSVDGAFTGITQGYNAVDDDDLAVRGFGHEHAPRIVSDRILARDVVGTVAVTITTAYPGPTTTTGWTTVTMGGTDIVIRPQAGQEFEVGPNSPEKIGSVLVGAVFDAEIFPLSDGHLAIGVKHSGIATVEAILATDFVPLSYGGGYGGQYSIEYTITEDDVPPGETLEEIWLVASGPAITIQHGQLWALPLHGE